MSIKPRSHAQVRETQDRIEREIERAVSLAIRRVLTRLNREVTAALDGPSALVAAAPRASAPTPGEIPTLGTIYGWWNDEIDAAVLATVRSGFREVWHEVSTGRIEATSLDASEDFIARVRDRLVRGITPPLPDDAFERVRSSLALGAGEGWDRERLAQRIAAELSWEDRGPYWRAELARANEAIEAILDPLGPPGHPAREYARLHDPRVNALQAERSKAVLRLDAEKSYWQTRAMRIARTEATGAANYGALSALHAEGATHKEWLAAPGPRTRPEHAAAAGQVVAIDAPFEVGGYHLQMPGDPSGPAHLVINCRCSLVGARLPE